MQADRFFKSLKLFGSFAMLINRRRDMRLLYRTSLAMLSFTRNSAGTSPRAYCVILANLGTIK